MVKNQIDCIVRFHDSSRLLELNRCIFSLVGQFYKSLNIIIVVQRFTDEELCLLRANLASLMKFPNCPTIQIENLTNSSSADARTELLNLGLDAARGQYVAFLDYDDVLYPEAYSILVQNLRSTHAGIAFATVRLLSVDIFSQFLCAVKEAAAPFSGSSLSDLFRANFCPIHSYLIDRSVVSADILRFNTSLTWEEDYDLLLRICATYASDFSALGTVIGDYYFKSDGSNTVAHSVGLSQDRVSEYAAVAAQIEVRRCITDVSAAVLRQLGIASKENKMSIRDVINVIGNK
ncbi:MULTISPECIES: glycosyltransferase [unclassified Undibacterium]|nr:MULTISPECIES: glycosyltransferase [unclassified Undibacterium]WPX44968.1 glycosyltransferase [Undibacterium sp. CCC3.4]